MVRQNKVLGAGFLVAWSTPRPAAGLPEVEGWELRVEG